MKQNVPRPNVVNGSGAFPFSRVNHLISFLFAKRKVFGFRLLQSTPSTGSPKGSPRPSPTKSTRRPALPLSFCCLFLLLPSLNSTLTQLYTQYTLADSNGQALPVLVPFLAAPWRRRPSFPAVGPRHVGTATAAGCQPGQPQPSFLGKSVRAQHDRDVVKKDRARPSGLANVCGHGILSPNNPYAGICTTARLAMRRVGRHLLDSADDSDAVEAPLALSTFNARHCRPDCVGLRALARWS